MIDRFRASNQTGKFFEQNGQFGTVSNFIKAKYTKIRSKIEPINRNSWNVTPMKIRRTIDTLKKQIEKRVFPSKEKPESDLSPLKKMEMGSVAVRMEGIVKRFPGVLANDHIDFEVKKGEIHGLLGENGAGKTTLMDILYGLYQPDEGRIFVAGKKMDFRSPLYAIDAGIGMVHQHFMLIPVFTVAENVSLGLKSSGIVLDLDRVKDLINELSSEYGLEADSGAKIWQLSVGEQQRVEIIKALSQEADLLILDEPTSVLAPQEVQRLFTTLRSMIKHGLSIVFITHKLHEVLAISDRITVLRHGKVVSVVETSKTSDRELCEMMVGRTVLFELGKPPVKKGKVILEIDRLWALSDKGVDALKGVSFDTVEGEILGIAGVAGNGQRELIEVITGLRKATKGKVLINGRDMTNHSPKEIIRQKVTYVPEDRVSEGLIADFTIADNLILKNFSSYPFSRRGFLNRRGIRRYVDESISEFDIRTSSRSMSAKTLSGGNLQKLLLARELAQVPRLLIAAQPTKGLDVGATEYIRKKLIEQRGKGTAILLVSEDLDELLALSDRIAVMYEGQLVGLMERERVSIKEIGLMMCGAKKT